MSDNERELATLTADVVALAEHDGQPHVLLVRRGWDPFAGMWALPGGHVGVGETVEDAGRRECLEETGVTVARLDLVGVYSAPGRDPRGRYVTWAWLARFDAMPTPIAGDDATAARWVPVDDALRDGLAFDHAAILRDAIRQVGYAQRWPSNPRRA